MKSWLTAKNSKTILLGTLALVILVSGCLGSSGGGSQTTFGGGSDGLVLNIDTEGRTDFDSLDQFIITLEAENVGEFDAKNVQARLQGFGGIINLNPGSLSTLKKLTPNLLDRPDFDTSVLGGTGDVTWSVKAPFVSEVSPELEINLAGEIVYDYQSLATRQVVVVTSDELEKRDARGEGIPVSSSTEQVNGPISVDLITDDPYVRVTSDRDSFRLKILLTNDGSGNLYDRGTQRFDLLKKLTVRIPAGLGVDEDNCDLKVVAGEGTSDKTLVIDDTRNPDRLRLVEGGLRRDLQCHLTVAKDSVGGFNTYTLETVAEYTYLQSIDRRLYVTGTEQSELEVAILRPTTDSVDDWRKGESNHEVDFTVTYQGRELSGALGDVNVFVGDKKATVSSVASHDGVKYTITVATPDLGAQDSLEDLTVQVEYATVTGESVRSRAVQYKA